MTVGTCCNGKPAPAATGRALGFTIAPAAGLPTWAIIASAAAAALILYRLLFSAGAREKRSRLKAAKSRYRAQVARIKAEA